MRTPTRLGLGLVAFVTLALSPCASANLVTNPGFETGNFSGWTLSGNTIGAGVSGPPAAHSGAYGAFFHSTGSPGLLSQDLATISGATYTLSFWLGHSAVGSPNSFSASFGGTPVFSLTGAAGFAYTMYSFNVVATNALTTLQFAFLESGGEWLFDDVSVEFLSGPSVPETGSTLAFLGLALVAIAGLRRKLAAA